MAIKISGVTIIDDSRNIVSGAAATFTSNVTIGGTLTYEDVTNIDSVGVITAREGISIPNLKGINLGDSNELNIINSNNSAFIQHSGSGYLFIHGNDIALRSQAQKNYIVCDADNEVELYFNNSPKFKTTNTGVEVNHAGGGVLNVTSINATDGDYAGIVTAQGFVGGGINTLSESIFKDMSVLGGINISGVATATAFSGDGSNLTNLPVSSFFTNTDVGIHTLAKVGIGTTNPIAQLDVNVGSSVTALNIEGSEGQLFSVTNNLSSGSIFAVNDITGLPSVDVNADGTIQLAPRGAGELVGIGTTVPTSKVHIVGDTLTSGISTFASSIHVADSIIHQGDTDTKIEFSTNDIRITAANKLRIHHASNGLNYFNGNNISQATSTHTKLAGSDYVHRFRDEEGDDTLVQFFNTNVKNSVLEWNAFGNSTTAGNLIFRDINSGNLEYARFTGTGSFNLAKDFSVAGVSTFSDDVNLPNDKKVKYGNMGFQIYQNTSASNNAIIEQSASGQFLRLITNGGSLSLESDYINMRNSANNANVASFDADGAANLRFNSNLKFFTKTDGAGVIGILTANGLAVTSGVSTFAGNINANGNIIGDDSTNISGINTVGANFYYGCGGIGSRLFQQDSGRNLIAGTNAGLAITLTTSPPPLSNILIGCCAGSRIRSQCYNVAIGVNAAMCTAAGSGGDTFVGSFSGQKAGCCGGTGNQNAFFGYASGYCGYNPIGNTYIGYAAAKGHPDSTGGTGGTCNVAIGYNAASSIRAGNNNVLIGRYVGASHSTASNNIALGNAAMYYTLSGGGNLALGSQVLEKNLTGFLNVALSCNALYNNTTGACNIAIGHNALYCNTTFNTNIAIGRMAGYKATCGPNVMIGEHTGCIINGAQNTIVGQNAGKNSTEATGNSFFGQCAGYCNSTGDRNAYVGCRAGFGNTTGNCNIAIGNASGPQTCGATGCYNATLGIKAGCSLTSGSYNIFLGNQSGNTISSGSRNIAIGCDVELPSATGDDQFAIGCGTGRWIAGDSSFNTTLAGISTAKADGTFLSKQLNVSGVSTFSDTLKVGTGLTVKGNGQAVFSGVTTFTGNNNPGARGAIHLPFGCMLVFGDTYLRGAIYNSGTQLYIQALNAFKFRVWDGNGMKDWLNVGGVGGQITLGGCDMGVTGSNKTHMFRLNPHKITMCSSVPDSSTQTKRFELDSHGIQLTGITTIAGNVNVTGVVTATHFYGDGSNLTGISGGGGGISTTFFASSAAGIHTLSKVGIGTALPNAQLDVNVGSSVTAFNVEGSEGQLFSITNNLSSGSIFAVNDITGLPSIDVNADGTIQLAPRSTTELVGIGTTVPTSKVHIVGTLTAEKYKGDTNRNIIMGVDPNTVATSGVGTANVLIGDGAGKCNTDGAKNVFIGYEAGKLNTTPSSNVAIGNRAGCCLKTGGSNTFLGVAAGMSNCSGTSNVFLGSQAALNATTSKDSVVIGLVAGKSMSTGNNNVLIGRMAGCQMYAGSANVYLGNCSGYCTQGHHNLALGQSSGHHRAGSKYNRNILLGSYAGQAAGTLAVGNYDILIGYNAGVCYTGSCSIGIGQSIVMPTTAGMNQLAIGQQCCYWITGSCDYNVGIGISIPTSKLHVVGDVLVSGASTFTGVSTFTGALCVNQLKFADSNGSSTNIAMFGNSNDLKIYHSGNHSFIQDTGTGGLAILGSFVELATASGSEKYFRAVANGAAILYHNNVERLYTTSTGIQVDSTAAELNIRSGTASATGEGNINFENVDGNGQPRDVVRIIGASHGNGGYGELKLQTAFNNSLIDRLIITQAGDVGIGSAIPAATLDIHASTNTPSSDTGTTMLQLTNDTGSDIKGLLGQRTFIDFKFLDTNVNFVPQVRIGAQVGNSSGTDGGVPSEGSGNFVVYTATGSGHAGAGTLSEKFRVTNDGKVGIGQSQPSRELSIHSADSGSTYLQLSNSTTGTGVNDGLIMGVGADEVARIRQTENNNLTFSTNDVERLTIFSDGSIMQNHGNPNASATFKISKSGAGAAELRFDTAASNTASLYLGDDEQLRIRYGSTEHTRFSSDGNVKVGAGITLEGGGDAYVTGITTLGRGSTGDVYLYNPSNSALSGTENSVYGWKAKTFCGGLQVNSAICLSRGGTNGLSLAYNNATGGYITQSVGFLNISAVGGPPINYSAYCHSFKNPGGTKFLTMNQDGDKAVDLYYNNSQRLATTNEGILVSGGATVTGNLSVGGTVTYEDVTNVDSIGVITARSGLNVSGVTTISNDLHIKSTLPRIYLTDTNHDSDWYIGNSDGTIIFYDETTTNTRFEINPGINIPFIRTPFNTNSIFRGETTLGGHAASPAHSLTVGGISTFSSDVRLTAGLNVSGVSTFNNNIDVVSTDSGSSAAPELTLHRNSASPADADYLGNIKFSGKHDAGSTVNYAKISGKILDASSGTEDGILEFMLRKAGSNNIAARFRSDSLQLLNGTNLTVAGTTTLSDNLDITGTIDSTVAGADNALTLETTTSGDPKICFNAAGAGGHRIEYLRDSLTLNFTNGTSNRLQISAQGHTLPGINDTYDLGSNTVRWRCTFVDKYVGDADLNVTIGCNAGLGITAASTTACKNIIIGHCAGQRLSTCSNNIFIGSCAGQNAMAPVLVTAIGEKAGHNANCIGGTLTAVGAFAGMCNTDGDGNTFIGGHAGRYAKGSGSAYNFYGGYQAGKVSCYASADNPTGGSCNIAIGFNAFNARAGGANNVILGRYAGAANSTGSNNMAFGNSALAKSVSGGSNFAGGYLTLHENLTGSANIAIGHAAMRCNVSASHNVGIGYCALALNTIGTGNVALGECAMRCHDTNGGHNFAAGYSAMRESEGSHNQVIGHTASFCNTTGCFNTSLGYQAGKCNTTGCRNVSIGQCAGIGNETSSDNVSIGQHSHYCGKGAANIAIGRKTRFHDDLVGNSFNIAIGDCAMMGATDMGTSEGNIAIGRGAGFAHSGGLANIYLGCYVGACNKSGNQNFLAQRKAGYRNETGSDNVMIGDCAGYGDSGSGGTNQNYNVFIGKYAGYQNRGDHNIGIGFKAGCAIQTGTCNIFFGPQTGICASTGSNNIGLGFQVMTLANLTGDNNIALGHYTGRRIATGQGNVFLGAGAGRYVLGGCCNVAIGVNAHYCLSGGHCNVAIGVHAGTKQTASDQNVSIGHQAGNRNETGSGNVAVGHSAGYGIRGANNVSIGATAGPADSCTDTYDNVFIGSRTGTAYTSGCNIIAIGINAGASSCCAATGCNNIHIGQNTGCKTQSGDNNITIGCRAGRNLTTGRCNIFMGLYAGGTVTDASGIVAIGNRTAQNATASVIAIGCCAGGQFGGGSAGGIFIGRCAGRYANASDSSNIVMGGNAGRSLTCGLNIIIGSGAAYPATTACRNIGMGGQSHQKLTTGDGNLAFGTFALAGNTTGCCNIAIGDRSGALNCGATGSCNVTISVGSGHSLTTGSDNVFVGRCAGYGVTSGYKNISIGLCAGYGHGNHNVAGVGIGTDNVFIGSCAGRCVASASRNVFIGREAGQRINDGCYNVAIGDQAGCCMMSGHSNTVVGSFAAYHLCSGGSNTYMGLQAALCATTGSQNTIIGNTAGKTLSTGGSNVAVGHFAGCTLGSGGGNVMVGNCAGYRSSGGHNVMLGHSAGWDRLGSQFKYNVLVGSNAGYARGTQPDGAFDVLIGFYAGSTYTGTCSIGIGHSLVMPITDGKNQLAIGQEGNYWITGSSNRKVGIGISDPQNYFSSYNDMVVGNTNDTGGITIVSQNGSGASIAFAEGKSGNQAYRGLIRYDNGNDKLQFNTNANTGTVTIDQNGNLGINTASPAASLHALGRIHTDRFFSNPTSLDTSVTFPESGGAVNGGVFGPYTIASGVTLTIASGSTFKVL